VTERGQVISDAVHHTKNQGHSANKTDLPWIWLQSIRVLTMRRSRSACSFEIMNSINETRNAKPGAKNESAANQN
jgi:hypothetical protein